MNYISTTSNQALMAQALKSLIGKWGVAIGSWLVFVLLTGFSFNTTIWEWQGDNGENYNARRFSSKLKYFGYESKNSSGYRLTWTSEGFKRQTGKKVKTTCVIKVKLPHVEIWGGQ